MTPGRNRWARAGAALLGVRAFVRAPIWFYRARLGVVFGSRLLMLEHVGRTSGRRRFVVREVVDHPTPERFVVVSGFGARAQWFRNVAAHPEVRLYRASRRPVRGLARRLDGDAAAESLGRYASAHPRAWAKLKPVLEQTLGARIDAEGTELPMMALDVVDGRAGSGR